jgi:hypothetical protein
MHVSPKEEEQVSLAADLFVILPNKERSSDNL